jgi:hypothetical protein
MLRRKWHDVHKKIARRDGMARWIRGAGSAAGTYFKADGFRRILDYGLENKLVHGRPRKVLV